MIPSNKETPHFDVVRSQLALAHGAKTIRGWARARGYNEKTVYGVLKGRLTGKHGGKAARIIVDLRRLVA